MMGLRSGPETRVRSGLFRQDSSTALQLGAGGMKEVILGLMAICGQADLLDVVGDREKVVDPRLRLGLDCCAV